MTLNASKHDVFISHAVEDKISIVNELVEKLEAAGINAWYSSQKLRVGRGVEETIKEGLNRSSHGIVVLTHNYFTKDWPRKEFNALWAREGTQIYPVWHEITKEEIQAYDPQLADKWALNTKSGIDNVVYQLVKCIHEDITVTDTSTPEEPISGQRKGLTIGQWLVAMATVAAVAWGIYYFLIRDVPANNLIATTIQERMDILQEQITTDHKLEMNERQGTGGTQRQVAAYVDRYNDIKAQYRNEYYFSTGYQEYNFKKNVDPALGVSTDLLTPGNDYGFAQPNIYIIDFKPSPHTMDVKYIYINSQPPTYSIVEEIKLDDFSYTVTVSYENYIRYMAVDLAYSKRSDWMKRRQKTFRGMEPTESYSFKKKEDSWVFAGLLEPI